MPRIVEKSMDKVTIAQNKLAGTGCPDCGSDTHNSVFEGSNIFYNIKCRNCEVLIVYYSNGELRYSNTEASVPGYRDPVDLVENLN